MKRIQIYTDGGCDKNPGGVGAWAAQLVDGDKVVERSGGADKTTNNRMELTAAIEAIALAEEHLPKDRVATVDILTDSQYLAMGMNEWVAKWQLHNWTLKDGSPVKNTDLWKRLIEMQRACRHRITWRWVQGHSGDPHNTRVDRLVQQAMKGKPGASEPNSLQYLPEASPPQLKLIRKEHKPHAVRIFQKGSSAGIEIPWEHLLGFIEDLLRVQREGDEG